MIERIIDTYWEATIINGRSFLFTNRDAKLKKATFCISIFYFFVFYLSIKTFSPYGQFPRWNILINSEQLFTPLWSTSWIKFFDWEITVKIILFFFFTSSFFAVIFWRRFKLARVTLFVSMFLYLSLIFSFSNEESWMYLMTFTSFLLIFIPNSNNKNFNEIGLLQVFFGIQTFLLNVYFVSGFFKFYGLILQEINGSISAINSTSLAEYSGMNAYHHNTTYFFTSFILNNPSYFFSIFLILGFCVEFFSIYVIFKPKYHRIWGILMVLLHGFIIMFIGPDFAIQVLVIGVFIFFSPFTETSDFYEDLRELKKRFKTFFDKPNLGDSVIIFYDTNCKICNGFLHYISNYDIPKSVSISSQDSYLFSSVVSNFPDISSVGSIVVIENYEVKKLSPNILVKANAITWMLAKFHNKFKALRILYLIVPFFGNLLYDLITIKKRKITKKA